MGSDFLSPPTTFSPKMILAESRGGRRYDIEPNRIAQNLLDPPESPFPAYISKGGKKKMVGVRAGRKGGSGGWGRTGAQKKVSKDPQVY